MKLFQLGNNMARRSLWGLGARIEAGRLAMRLWLWSAKDGCLRKPVAVGMEWMGGPGGSEDGESMGLNGRRLPKEIQTLHGQGDG